MTRALFLLLPLPILAADPLSGRWRLDMRLSTGDRKAAFLDLHLKGSAVSGTWTGLLGEEASIQKGTWHPPEIQFEFPWQGDHPGVICKVAGELKNGKLQLELRGDGWVRREVAYRSAA